MMQSVRQLSPETCRDLSGQEILTSKRACHFIKSSVAMVFGITMSDLNAQTRLSADIAFARQLAMYVAHVRLGLKLGEIGRAFGRDRTTVAHACRVIEDRRDEPAIDFLVDCLERSLDEWLGLAALDGSGGKEGRRL